MISERLQDVRQRIAEAAARSGRSENNIKLLAASKTVSVDRIRQAISSGQMLFGENYVQEARKKIESLGDLKAGTVWHFIGHLQRNKARTAIRLFDCIESLDSLRLAAAIDRHAQAAGKKMPVFVEVNVAEEASKSGIPPEQLRSFLQEVAALQAVEVCGLMTMPPWDSEPEASRPWFRILRQLKDEMNDIFSGQLRLEELSMGMSADFEIAIEEGATVVRIGTALFGNRPEKNLASSLS
ncbi:MAG TPA: YggS family pyridoxal phosphate-dependent enzyme [Thermodesulfobacteriaceae bacterium]|nr:YggS family pyridoxal phosphate-dependent enzyme [Thermodesulfobacteriaceae bacterium]